eukprot:CAMPEP_0168773610 /NCGR_PEP_ID=MMETSP0725-20121227/4562_1 /TAXON_ID=265536 /ORGANISM="Amphiprora sp., Strain CCMP467" /LENGTH=171 /DNA_ID=CAMNT_0008823167 /DNA_START=912 /DNA_END=1424 /DNA_ORIENTATION=+
MNLLEKRPTMAGMRLLRKSQRNNRSGSFKIIALISAGLVALFSFLRANDISDYGPQTSSLMMIPLLQQHSNAKAVSTTSAHSQASGSIQGYHQDDSTTAAQPPIKLWLTTCDTLGNESKYLQNWFWTAQLFQNITNGRCTQRRNKYQHAESSSSSRIQVEILNLCENIKWK